MIVMYNEGGGCYHTTVFLNFIMSRPLEASMDDATYCDSGRSYFTKLKLSQ